MKIAVTGAEGQLGSEFKIIAKDYPDHSFNFLNKSSLDITSENSVKQFFKHNDIDFLINCAAYTAVDKAELEKDKARIVNEEAPRLLAQYCQEHNCVIIHYSSDYVYHKNGPATLTEQDNVNPKSIYAKTKLAGERAVLNECLQSIIIRTSWVYSSFGKNFVKTMLQLGRDREKVTIVNDQIGTPTYARDIAEATMHIVDKIKEGSTENYGVYNYSNLGITNWMDFAKKIFELENIQCEVYPTSTLEYGAAAERPLWSVLSKDKIQADFGLKIPHWEDSLSKCLLELKSVQH